MAVIVELDVMLARRKMSVGDFANAVGITPANVAVLKNGRARAGSPPWTRSAGCSIASRVTSSGGPPTRPPSGNALQVAILTIINVCIGAVLGAACSA
jgi:hypothetical protein